MFTFIVKKAPLAKEPLSNCHEDMENLFLPFFRTCHHQWERMLELLADSFAPDLDPSRSFITRAKDILVAGEQSEKFVGSLAFAIDSQMWRRFDQNFLNRFIRDAACCPHHLINDQNRSPNASRSFSFKKNYLRIIDNR